jgi:Shedu protein SduA, C-terminal
VQDGDSLRAHLKRLAERLRPYLPGASDSHPAPPASGPQKGSAITRRMTRADALQDDDLAAAFVWWDDIRAVDVETLRQALEAANDERPLQRHLANKPLRLVQHLRGGGGRWVLSQKRLGSEYVTDFVIGERSSGGFEWYFVELQSPRARLFVPSTGRLSPQLDEGIRQIQEWRRWLDDNRDYARRPRSRNGLGLVDVSSRDPG